MKDPKDDYIRYADSLNKKHTLQKKKQKQKKGK